MDRNYELQTHQAEDRHWWYRGRRRVLDAVISGLALGPQTRILDAGCGSGRNMLDLARYGEVTGIELSDTSVGGGGGGGKGEGRERAGSRAPLALHRAPHTGEVLQGSILDMPFTTDSFDLAVCLDVVEHLQDDRQALSELRRVVAPGGSLLVTVPAYERLWSTHDEINHHHRRYNRRTLLQAAEDAGWKCSLTTHFNSLLLPIAALLRALDRLHTNTAESSLDLWIPPAPINSLLQLPLNLEAALVKRGLHIPAGLSLLALLD
jgi:SAM-dependent methyltransferase